MGGGTILTPNRDSFCALSATFLDGKQNQKMISPFLELFGPIFCSIGPQFLNFVAYYPKGLSMVQQEKLSKEQRIGFITQYNCFPGYLLNQDHGGYYSTSISAFKSSSLINESNELKLNMKCKFKRT